MYMLSEAGSVSHSRSVANDSSRNSDTDSDTNAQIQNGKGAYPRAVDLPPVPRLRPSCDEPRLFHMFWTGPFTDKPYMALLSFLYTQNLGLHLPADQPPPTCKTELWLWISQPEWSFYKRATWEKRMEFELRANPWAAPFLHPRFKDVIKFKVWDAAERLDETEELKDDWRKYHHIPLVKFKGPRENVGVPDEFEDDAAEVAVTNDMIDTALVPRAVSGTSSSSSYNKASVALSDLVRFVLCHRFGGIYLDVDTLFLRDWEELWGWPGAFAYRWSRLDRYNTAVLRMHKGSALGTFILRTGLKNGLNFHPIRIGSYLRDAQMEGLLTRLPDALFDPAWLMTEGYHLEKPPQPFMKT